MTIFDILRVILTIINAKKYRKNLFHLQNRFTIPYMNNQRKLERLMVEELSRMDALDDVVYTHSVKSVKMDCFLPIESMASRFVTSSVHDRVLSPAIYHPCPP